MRKPQYWMLAVMFLTACMSGLYVIGVAIVNPSVVNILHATEIPLTQPP